MKKLRIERKYIELLEEKNLGAIYDSNYEICYGANRSLNISKFRFLLHKIVELINIEEKDKEHLNKEISDNNFTNLIIMGILVLN